jgi:DNA modification methylase
MPESVKTRCTKSHEYIFLLSKSDKYYFDAESISEPIAENTRLRFAQKNIDKQKGSIIQGGGYREPMKPKPPRFGGKKYTTHPDQFYRTKSGNIYEAKERRNKRSVWTVTTKPFTGAHFATFPPDLIEPCILAGSRQGGVVLDPFFGAGTTGLVADANGRDYIGIEINPEYAKIAENRIAAAREQETKEKPAHDDIPGQMSIADWLESEGPEDDT